MTEKKKSEEKPAPLEVPPEAPVQEEAPKKRGRPPKTPNKTDPDVTEKGKPRKAVKDLKHKAKARQRKIKETNAVIEAENAERRKKGEAPLSLVKDPAASDPIGKKIPPEVCTNVARGAYDMLGTVWQVETRPDPEALAMLGEAMSDASQYILIDPKYMAFGMVAVGGFACAIPMIQEKRAKKAAGTASDQAPPANELDQGEKVSS